MLAVLLVTTSSCEPKSGSENAGGISTPAVENQGAGAVSTPAQPPPWDSEHNKRLLDKMPDVYRAPNSNVSAGMTCYAFPVLKGGVHELISANAMRRADIPDGVDTVMLVEADDERAVPWTKPVDLVLSHEDPWDGIRVRQGSAKMLFADGMVYDVPRATTDRELMACLSANAGDASDIPWLEDPAGQIFQSYRYPPSALQDSLDRIERLASAMQRYRAKIRTLPSAIRDETGQALLSWRVALLPALGRVALYRQFRLNEPWDSDHNKALLAEMPDVYRTTDSKSGIGMTSFVLPVYAQGTVGQNRSETVTPEQPRPWRLILLEVGDDHSAPWTKPQDFQFDPQEPWRGLRVREGKVAAGKSDGVAESIDRSMSDQDFRQRIVDERSKP